jgi:DNA-binding transcriptional MerR regulator
MFKISDFSKLSQVSVKALRYYDELGLLEPAQIDRFTSYRYYSIDQLPRLNRILALKDLGLSLEQIGELLNNGLSPEQLRGMLKLKQAELQQQAEQVQEQLARVKVRLSQIEQEGKMPKYDVVIKKIEPQWVASIRDVVPTPPDQGRLWDELDAYLGQHKVKTVGPCLTIYHDTEYKERDWDLEVCEPLGTPIPGSERVRVRELPGVETMACVLHHGDFSNIGETYNAMMAWIQANGYQIVGSNREVYLRAVAYPDAKAEYPASYLTDKEENRLTEVQFPVEKA